MLKSRSSRRCPKMIKAAGSDELSSALESHLEETRGHVERLERVLELIDIRPRGKHCAGMAGILEEGANLMEEDGDESVLDAGFIAAAQLWSITRSPRTDRSWPGRRRSG